MDILWDEAKKRKLKKTRGLSFEEVAQLILEKKYLVLKTVFPSRRFHKIYAGRKE